ncbi:mannan-binding lectin serine protease 2 [Discoglossus pictus]
MRLLISLLFLTVTCSKGDVTKLSGLFGRITSPGFPKPYPNEQLKYWNITAPEGHVIKIYFTDFNVELSYLCEYDYLKLSSMGTDIAHFCGKESTDTEKAPETASFYSLDNTMTVTFRSDYSNEKELTGFEAFFAAEDINECERVPEPCDHYCHNHIGGYYCSCRIGFTLHRDMKTCIVNCDGLVYRDKSGEITSPDYPGIYPKLTNCKYSIQIEAGFTITLKFVHFDVESHPDVQCPYDKLQITTGGNNLAPLCGDTIPAEINIRSNKVDLVFTTDDSGQNTGWRIMYTTKALPCPNPVLPPRGHFAPRKETYVVRDKLTLTCDTGYGLMQGERTLESFTTLCQITGMWDKPMATCIIKDCGPPEDITNGTYTYVTAKQVTTYKSEIQYSCPGSLYHMKGGEGHYWCGANADWVDKQTSVQKLPTCVPDCGKRIKGARLRIIGGKSAALGEFPWQVYLRKEDEIGGGALLNDDWVITAAHVVHGYTSLSDIVIKMGFLNITAKDFIQAWPETIIIHEGYKHGTNYDNDIALIKLKNKVTISENVLGICLPTKEDGFKISHEEHTNHMGLVSGWGVTHRGTTARRLQFVQVDIIEQSKCKSEYFKIPNALVTDNMICAGKEEGKKDSCQGDSGGALVFYNGEINKWFIGGIVSWGGDCGTKGQYGVYTKVSNYLDWIEDKMQKHAV